MFHTMIMQKCAKWFASPDCTVKSLVQYMEKKGELRDAQIEAIKTYLFLKIACGNKPLWELFTEGAFNSITDDEIDKFKMSRAAREKLLGSKAARSLYEYATQRNEKGEMVSEKTAQAIMDTPEGIDYKGFFKKAFYGVTYTDYLFSLPMGAGKTFLMMAFIYLDLYFAMQDEADNRFAHNFIILVPSGLKSSVVPSLREIEDFDGEWILPPVAARNIKQELHFEILDKGKSGKKSNRARDPNVQKIALHQPFESLTGLVAVTNAEKVILDNVKLDEQGMLIEDTDEEKEKDKNELRYIIGQIPHLAVFIDEVHHAASEDKKLRAVVTKWASKKDEAAGGSVTNVLGFTGTPYLEKAEKVDVTSGLKVSSLDISSTVDYYPLFNAIGNFLKVPQVKISDSPSSLAIIEEGIRCFLDKYKDTVYRTEKGELCAKLGIYCGAGINFLEEEAYPVAVTAAREYGLDALSILRYHGGNKAHPASSDSEKEFAALDTPPSQKRIVLLCQIGKEGWNCKSLTGIVLSQEGDCPTNMVLQTSCRCLRQVCKSDGGGVKETALIYLNKSNGELLQQQLQQQQRMTLDEFQTGARTDVRAKYDRTEHLKLPPVKYRQMRITFDETITQKADPERGILAAADDAAIADEVIITKTLSADDAGAVTVVQDERGEEYAAFHQWVYRIATEGVNCVNMSALLKYEDALRSVFDTITYRRGAERYYSAKYDQRRVRANIRKSFCDKRTIVYKQETFDSEAHLLCIEGFEHYTPVRGDEAYYPDETVTENIIKEDRGERLIDGANQAAINALKAAGQEEMAKSLALKFASHAGAERSFHYLPYRTDSGLERQFLQDVLGMEQIERLGLEVYYNGDGSLTEFKIDCYEAREDTGWHHVGIYTPDFLIVKRNKAGDKIERAIIVEMKGSLYANDPNFKVRKAFTAGEFIRLNTDNEGYKRFDYLFLEDTMSGKERVLKTAEKIREFFE